MRLLPLLLLALPAVHGGTIVQDTTEADGIATNGIWGESFVTPSGGPWNNITFNFFSDIPAVTPSAAGTAWLLDQPLNPDLLHFLEFNQEAGIIGETSGIVGGEYVFDSSVVLQPNTQYFLFEDGPLTTSGGGGSPAGQEVFSASAGALDFPTTTGYVGSPGVSANYRVTGDPLATPEPPPLVLVTLGVVLLAFSRYKVRKPAKL